MPEVDTRKYYEDFSTSYDRMRDSPYHGMLDELCIEIAAPYARGHRVLELGCGTGRILGPLNEMAAEAIGVDFASGMVAQAKSRGLDARHADLCELPFPDASFDLTCSFKVLPHVPDPRRAIAEAARVTKRTGHLILEVYNPISLRYLAKRLGGARPVGEGARTEAEVPTRWETRRAAVALLPEDTALVDHFGVRIFTPFAGVHRVPLFGDLLRKAERAGMRSPLRSLGGFLVLLVRKT